MLTDQVSPLIDVSALCARLSISRRTIENMVRAQLFPPPVRIGKKVYWSEKTVAGWQLRLFADQESWVGRLPNHDARSL
ncbi:helix-turn-helix transcriptional regulator [Uliginosibacterium flavum]|uniref:Helix-turn-helix domain-containing protein n=1 Tax=Uliginosibacterium flavum TaxID=1396831 RepID=A0ABV2TH19_9RHOO